MEAVCIILPDDRKYQKLWDYALMHFRPVSIYIIGGDEKDLGRKAMRGAISINAAGELPNDIPLILMSPKNARNYPGTLPLTKFNHPDKAIYMFGPDDNHVCDDHMGSRTPDVGVFIPTETDDQMYAHVAYNITAWDLIHG